MRPKPRRNHGLLGQPSLSLSLSNSSYLSTNQKENQVNSGGFLRKSVQLLSVEISAATPHQPTSGLFALYDVLLRGIRRHLQ